MHLQPPPLPGPSERAGQLPPRERWNHDQAHQLFLRALQQEATAAELPGTAPDASNEQAQPLSP